jgi:hypothetical protein
MSKTRPDDDAQTRLRLQARLHGGVVPVPFLGTTWQTRGSAYWRRRVGAVAVFFVGLALVGGMAVGFTIGIVGTGHDIVRVLLAVVYGLTAIAGIRTGRSKIAEAPLDNRTVVAGTSVPNGLLALVLAPYGTGLVLTMLIAMFGHDFIGERRAREASHGH